MVLHTEIAADLQKRYGVSSETAVRLVSAASAVAGSIKGVKATGKLPVPNDLPKNIHAGRPGKILEATIIFRKDVVILIMASIRLSF